MKIRKESDNLRHRPKAPLRGSAASSQSIIKKDAEKKMSGTSFKEQLSTVQSENTEHEINALLDRLAKQGERLKAVPTLNELERYTTLIGTFLTHALNAYALESGKRHPRSTIQDPVQVRVTINDKLAVLTEQIMQREQDHLSIAAAIDDIRGILIDLRK